MKKKQNIIDNIVILVITLGLIFLVSILGQKFSKTISNMFLLIVIYLGSALLAGLVNAIVHEIGHVIFAKKNNFLITEVSIWFFCFTREDNQYRFHFKMIGNEAGYTETISKDENNLEKRYFKMTEGGIIASFVMLILSIVPIALIKIMPNTAYLILAMFLPVSAYYAFGSLIPTISDNVPNDGQILSMIKHNTDESKVMMAVLKYQTNLYLGKRPQEAGEVLLDIPQIQEDNLNFIMLLNAKYSYYLDKCDYKNAKATTDRLLELNENNYVSKEIFTAIQCDALYNYCTFDFDENKADYMMEDVSKVLNSNNDATNIRIKLAYLLRVRKELEPFMKFYDKGIEELDNLMLKGLAPYEKDRLDKLKKIYEDSNLSTVSNDKTSPKEDN